MKKNFKKREKIVLIVSILIILLILIIVLIFFKTNKSELKKYVDNTLLSSKKVSSYNAKISIIGDNISENYIVYNNGTKNTKLAFMKKVSNTNKEVKHNYTEETYKYTDAFLKGLYNVKITDTINQKVDEDKFIVKKFSITKNNMNKIIKNFDFKTTSECSGKVYIDNNDRIYLINYNCDNFNISAIYMHVVETK